MERMTTNNAYKYTTNLIPFKNSNGQLYGEWVYPDMYAVFSYGPHWPLFIWHGLGSGGAWFMNASTSPSRTTSKHWGYAYPRYEATMPHKSCAEMKQLLNQRETEMDKFKNKDGSLTHYALACGYIEVARLGGDKSSPEMARLWMDNPAYFVVGTDPRTGNPMPTESFSSLTEARRYKRTLVKWYMANARSE